MTKEHWLQSPRTVCPNQQSQEELDASLIPTDRTNQGTGMISILLAPLFIWSKRKFRFRNSVWGYLRGSDESFVIEIELPTLPEKGSIIELATIKDSIYRQLSKYLYNPKSPVTHFVESFREGKDFNGKSLKNSRLDKLQGLTNDEILSLLCDDEHSFNIYNGVWKIGNAYYIANSKYVYLECYSEL